MGLFDTAEEAARVYSKAKRLSEVEEEYNEEETIKPCIVFVVLFRAIQLTRVVF